MKSYIAFAKKEFMEQIRTYKLFILLALLFILGMMSPLFAKIMPDIIGSMDFQGMEIKIPEPTFLDAYVQFFKNISQMGFIALILIFSGLLSGELTRGTLVNMVSKGVSRSVIIFSKFTTAVVIWTIGYLIAIGTNFLYTFYLFGEHSVNNLTLSLFCLWLFGVFLISTIIFSSTITKGNYGGLIVTFIIYGVLMLGDLFPKVTKFNPYTLTSKYMDLLNNKTHIGDMNITIIVTIIVIALSILGALKIFKKNPL